MKKELNSNFKNIFKSDAEATYFSPGRVNLIGEHIDYNGGFVFPCALSFGTYGAVSKRFDRHVSVYSRGFSESIYSFSLDDYKKDLEHDWVDYIKGVFDALKNNGYHIPFGFNLFIDNTMPSGAGLSSSASLESLIVTILNDMHQLHLSIEKRALIGKEAENKYVGVNSGIMDQFACIAGKKDHAILLNTQTLDYQYIPLVLDGYKLVIVNTNKRRGLADSKYNERFSQCQIALNILKPIFHITDLCSLSLNQLEESQSLLDPVIFRRLRHVVSEQHRTIASTKALKANDIVAFAHYMNQSHDSLKNDYEVTGKELDTLQSLMLKYGATGARMTGAGFGGCVVAIVPDDKVGHIKQKVIADYNGIIGYEPTFYEVLVSNGTHLLK